LKFLVEFLFAVRYYWQGTLTSFSGCQTPIERS